MPRLRFVLLAAVIVLLAVRWQATPGSAQTGSATLCTGLNFTGTCITLTTSTPFFFFGTGVLAKNVKSVQLNTSVVVSLFDGSTFTGNCVSLRQSVPDLSVSPYFFLNKTASLLFGRPCDLLNSPFMTLFADADYGGTALTIYGSVPDLRAAPYDFNDMASSIAVTRRTMWAVYTDVNYTGTCETVSEGIPWLGAMSVGNDAISSVRSNYTCAGPAPDSYVADVTAVTGGSRNVTCGPGYTKKWQELNQGVGGDFVYACVKYTLDKSQALQEVYTLIDLPSKGKDPDYFCNGSDQPSKVDLNSGANNALDVTHEAIWFCKHKQGTNGGSGTAQDPSTGLYTRLFTTVPDDTRLRDLLFYVSVDKPACQAECQTAAADFTSGSDYLEFAVTALPFCQSEYDKGWFPAFFPWQTGQPETKRVPNDAGLEDLNAGLHLPEHSDNVYIYACVREGPTVAAAVNDTQSSVDTTPPIVHGVAVWTQTRCILFCVTRTLKPNDSVGPGTVTVTWICTDDQTRNPTVTPKQTFSNPGAYDPTGTCTDQAGNKATASVSFTITK